MKKSKNLTEYITK